MDSQLKPIFENKNILVTGGLGSIGSEIVSQILPYNPKTVKILDNRETELYYYGLDQKNQKNVSVIFGDVRDKAQLLKFTKGIDIIFHAAAMKHVMICEYHPDQAIQTNVLGTQNIIDCAFENNVERMMLISTDKAVDPTTVMGSTKLLAERLVSTVCNYRQSNDTKFGVVRFGNVLASRGSVLEVWEKQSQNGEKITVTDPEMTRFFMRIPDSVNLVFNATKYAENGEIFILKMPSIKIGDLANSFLKLKNFKSDKIEIIGKNEGEKSNELLISQNESNLLMENDELYVKLPFLFDDEKFQNMEDNFKKNGFKKSNLVEFCSDDEKHLLSNEQITDVIKNIDYHRI